jgi:hypothetical protein
MSSQMLGPLHHVYHPSFWEAGAPRPTNLPREESVQHMKQLTHGTTFEHHVC